MQSINNTNGEAPENWPRDFDIRAHYAEQQELLTPDAYQSVDAAVERDTPLQGNHKND
ncbi:hypothetical protein NJC38_25150 [Pseudomonas sp. 21LCFQ010]|uniref:hypothetical protein n=1 Tax=Pseudomonas sp. 21LCFQ010 TaxID=2957506 RepID=UPI00209715C0|nr:hypothetical protein [Pseudomonas sp. 21LCFQ010]MCO8165431.1 hypothetical protein [Pseudomonas sp. 21LCFQ010]